jgi:hypothetical protein
VTAHATSTSARAVRPGQREDRIMTATVTAITSTAPSAEEEARGELDYFAERFEALELAQEELLESSVSAIVDRIARRADGSLDLERLARMTVAAALRADSHVDDHAENPWWERIA